MPSRPLPAIVPLTAAVAIATGAATAPLAAQGVAGATLHRIALTGDAAPGAPGLAFDRFSAPPGVGRNEVPEMGRDGELVFHAFLGDGSTGTVEPGRAVFRATPGASALVARSGDTAPGTSAAFLGFPGITDGHPRIASGTVAFGSLLSDATIGVFRQARGGALEKVALQGERLPGMPADGRLFQMAFAIGGSGVLLNANWNDSGLPSLVKEGLWRIGTGAADVVAIGGMPAPGTDEVFGIGESVFGPVHRWSASPGGRLAFTGYLDGRHVDGDDDEGIWFEDQSGLRLLIREGDPVPGINGMRWGSSTGVTSFGSVNLDLAPWTNDNGDALFGATIHGRQTTGAHAVFVLRAGSLRHVATGQQVLPGNPPGDLAPGYGGRTFSHFVFGQLGASGGIAFLAAVAGSSFFDSDLAVYRDLDGTLELLAGEGLPLPALPAAVPTAVSLRGISDEGAVFYTADFGAAERALFVAPAGGAHRLLLRSGDVVDVDGVGDRRAVRDFAVGAGVAADDSLAVELLFADGSEGLFVLEPRARLRADATTLPVAGGRVGFEIDYGMARAGRPYALLGSISGPGSTVVGAAVLPIVLDPFSEASFVLANTPMFPGFLGALDAAGRAGAAFDSLGPLPPGALGLTARFAALLLAPLADATNAVAVTVVL